MKTSMIARIAEHLFWFGRYVERTDSTARLLYVTRHLVLDADLPPQDVWLPVLVATGEDEPFGQRFGIEAAADGEAVERYLTWDENCWVSLVWSVRMARENARSTRSIVSLEIWQACNELYLWLEGPEARAAFDRGRHDFYRHLQRFTQLIFGLTQSTMLHDQALDLVWLGVLLERAGQVARTLDVHHKALTGGADPALAAVTWLAVLRACSAFEPYSKRRPGQTTGPGVAEFLLFEADFPRGLRFALTEARGALQRLCPPTPEGTAGAEALAHLDQLCTWLDAQHAEADRLDRLHTLLTHVVDETAVLCQQIAQALFGQAPRT